MHIPLSIRQEVVCDGTSSNIPAQAAFFIKANFFNYSVNRKLVYVDYVVQVKKSETAILGEWQCRVNYWLQEPTTGIIVGIGFEYFKDGFRLAQTLANTFVLSKYGLVGALPNPSDAELWSLFQNIVSNQN